MSDTESDRDVDRDDMVNPDETDDDMQDEDEDGVQPLPGED
jgi:hypothetical protein